MRRRIILFLTLFVVIFTLKALALQDAERKKKEELFRQVELFSDGLTIIQTEYIDELKPKDLIYGALKGMMSSLDPHSQFLDPDTYNELKVDTEGKFGGVGIEITIKDGLLTVVTPIEDTPAWKAGIRAGDRIVKVNDESTRQMSLSDAVKKMRGKPQEAVNITIFREPENKILDFKIVRDIIKIKDIKEARVLEDGVAYIRLIEFRENTPKDISLALDNLTKAGMNALILDLRNNPGGLLDVAVEVAGKFIDKNKLVVYTKGRRPSQNLEFFSRSDRPLLNLPMVVLINAGSASGSEIVAGCLKDYQRAIIMGTKSFGKGSVQTVIPLSDGSALRLTTSKYFTPLGQVIHEKGVAPDIVVEEARFEAAKPSQANPEKSQEIFEELEKKENLNKEEKPKIEEKKEKQEQAFDYKKDEQLMRAVDVLKAVKFYFYGADEKREKI